MLPLAFAPTPANLPRLLYGYRSDKRQAVDDDDDNNDNNDDDGNDPDAMEL